MSLGNLATRFKNCLVMQDFHDGNKRIALVASFLFAELNGLRMTATEVDAAATFLALAAGELSEADLAKWFKANSRVKTIRR